MKMTSSSSFVLVLAGVAGFALLFGCDHSDDSGREETESFRQIISPPEGSSCIEQRAQYRVFEFSDQPKKVLKWLYDSDIGRERFSGIDYDSFVDESLRLIAAKKAASLLKIEREFASYGKKENYLIEVSVRELNATSWNCRITILRYP